MSLTAQLVWFRLRGKRFKKFKFIRSLRYGSHVIDFYCPSHNLAILVGSSEFEHLTQRELESRGIVVLRFTNRQIFHEYDLVIRSIQRELQILFPQGELLFGNAMHVVRTV